MTQVVERLPSKCEALSSNPKKKKEIMTVYCFLKSTADNSYYD
jgi:hypothetical protein